VTTTLRTAVDDFLKYKKVLGRKYRSEEHELRLLVRFADARGIAQLGELTPGFLETFLASRPRHRPRSFNHLLGAIRCFLEWTVSHQLLSVSPLATRRRRVTSARVPFLFDTIQGGRLLTAAAALPDNARAAERGATYHVIFAISYGLGLRAGEVCGLRLGDVNLEQHLLVVRGGKFGKSRLVPYGPRMARLVAEQFERRRAGRIQEEVIREPLFTFDGKRSIHPGTASQVFHKLVATLNLTIPDGVSPPRLHDLRHSFAVGCLLRWYREGVEPATRLHQLSTFMGHVAPSSTAVYLTITPELLSEANRRFETFAEAAWSELVS
jgi:site-specific recombinase XerD